MPSNQYKLLIRETNEHTIYFIFKFKSQNNNSLSIEDKHYFIIPNNKALKSYHYSDNYENFKLDVNDIMYDISYERWQELLRFFMKHDGTYIHITDLNILQKRE